jgi:hypothetical protein
LQRYSTHKVFDRSDASQFFATTGTSRTSMNEVRNWRSVPGRAACNIAIKNKNATVKRCYELNCPCYERAVITTHSGNE